MNAFSAARVHGFGGRRQSAIQQQQPVLALQDRDISTGSAEQRQPVAKAVQFDSG
jgi:hypothetical protein